MTVTFWHDKKVARFWEKGALLCATRRYFFFSHHSSPITSLLRPAAKCFLKLVSHWIGYKCFHKLNLLCCLCSSKVAGPAANKTKYNESSLEILESWRLQRERRKHCCYFTERKQWYGEWSDFSKST